MELAAIADAVAASTPMAVARDKDPGRTVHVDGDMLAYMAGGNESTTVAASRGILRNKIEKFKDMSGCGNSILHLTASGSLKGDRVLIAKYQPYQGNRAKANQPKPKNWAVLRDAMMAEQFGKIKNWDDREADDGFGYVSVHRHGDVVATQDKDMQMLFGWHIDWVTYELFYVPVGTYEYLHGDKVYGDKWFFLQMLMGDKADHIPGLIRHKDGHQGKVGPATASKFLAGTTCVSEALEVVIQKYKDTWQETWAEFFAENAGLLWIRRNKVSSISEWYETLIDPMTAKADHDALYRAVLAQSERINAMKQEAANAQAQGV